MLTMNTKNIFFFFLDYSQNCDINFCTFLRGPVYKLESVITPINILKSKAAGNKCYLTSFYSDLHVITNNEVICSNSIVRVS